MTRSRMIAAAVLAGVLLTAAAAAAGAASTERAAWLLGRAQLAGYGLDDPRDFQPEVGGLAGEPAARDEGIGGGKGLKVVASAVVPGLGEVLSGYRRGYLMIAADVFAWTRVKKYHDDGKQLSDDYYAFADAHYSDELLFEAYNTSSADQERGGLGLEYFNVEAMTDLGDLEKLPLYVSEEEDRREYYENLGKWDQFIFGWDDFQRPESTIGENPTYVISDLRTPEVSRNREIYRDMRDAANDAYQKRDRWLYVNIGLRVFSVLQTAWLNGLLGGEEDGMAVLGHRIEVAATPRGPYAGSVHAAVSF